jgi:undecaprenyl-diphosphatase
VKNIINYILIGFIQGFTEFLPISSSGHVILFGSFLQVDNLMLLSIVSHVGTLVALLMCYKKKVFQIVRHPKNQTTFNLAIATIPAVVCALLFNNFLESSFTTKSLVWGFLISSLALIVADLKKTKYKPIRKSTAFCMGLAQSIALFPGISRSGSTLCSALFTGTDKQEALDFSFLMSIPIIIASALYESIKLFMSGAHINWLAICVVLISSFIFGLISIKLMMKIVKSNKLYYFGIYLLILSWFVLAFC